MTAALKARWTHLFGAELVSAAHEVGTEQREGDGVSGLGRQFETLLEHLFEGAAVKAIRDRKREMSCQRLVQSYLINSDPVRSPPSMKESYLKTRATTDGCYGVLRADTPPASFPGFPVMQLKPAASLKSLWSDFNLTYLKGKTLKTCAAWKNNRAVIPKLMFVLI